MMYVYWCIKCSMAECFPKVGMVFDITVFFFFIFPRRWLHCLERNLDVFASSPDHIKMLIQRLAQLRLMDRQDTANRLKEV